MRRYWRAGTILAGLLGSAVALGLWDVAYTQTAFNKTAAPLVLQQYVNNSVTGSTVETNQTSVLIPGGAMGASGMILISVNYTYSATNGSKTFILRLASAKGIGGTAIVTSTQSGTQNQSGELLLIIRAAGTTNQQITQPRDAFGMGLPLAPITTTQDMSKDAYLNFDTQLATATDKVTLIGYTVECFNPS